MTVEIVDAFGFYPIPTANRGLQYGLVACGDLDEAVKEGWSKSPKRIGHPRVRAGEAVLLERPAPPTVSTLAASQPEWFKRRPGWTG